MESEVIPLQPLAPPDGPACRQGAVFACWHGSHLDESGCFVTVRPLHKKLGANPAHI